MSQENLDSLREAQHAFNRRDKPAWLQTYHPDGDMVPAKEWPESSPIHGAEAVWDFYIEVMAAWEEASFELGEIIDSGNDKIVANVRRETRGKVSGVGLEFSYWFVSTFRDGKLIRGEWFAQRAEALEAAGLRG